MFKKDQIRLADENGEERLYDVILTFDNMETGKSYIVYTENKEDEEGKLELYASIFNPEDENPTFEKIETEKEWEIINIVINNLKEKLLNEGVI